MIPNELYHAPTYHEERRAFPYLVVTLGSDGAPNEVLSKCTTLEQAKSELVRLDRVLTNFALCCTTGISAKLCSIVVRNPGGWRFYDEAQEGEKP